MKRKQRRKMLLIIRNVVMLCCCIGTCSLFLIQARNATYASVRSKNPANALVAGNSQSFSDRTYRLPTTRITEETKDVKQTDGDEIWERSNNLNNYQQSESDQSLEGYHQQNLEDDGRKFNNEGSNTEIRLEGEDSTRLQEQTFDQNPADPNSVAPEKENDPSLNLPDASYQDKLRPSENPGWRSRRELEQQLP